MAADETVESYGPLVLLPDPRDPTVSLRVVFQAGSSHDPPGKEGLASLTASIVAASSTRRRSASEVRRCLFPMAAEIAEQVDKELTVFALRIHRDHADEALEIFSDVLFDPQFDQQTFDMLRDEAIYTIRHALRQRYDEELCKKLLSAMTFDGTAYGHPEEGTVEGLRSITLEDVQSFYSEHYVRARVLFGIGGVFDERFVGRVRDNLSRLPAGTAGSRTSIALDPRPGLRVSIVEKPGNVAAISFGFPIGLLRGHPDFYALSVAVSWLGQHRDPDCRLFWLLRLHRGISYGAYAYIEHLPLGGHLLVAPANVLRQSQYFEVWIRAVAPEAVIFALRAALREVSQLRSEGIPPEGFALRQGFLKAHVLQSVTTTMGRLGNAIDDRICGIEEGHVARFRREMEAMTLERVNGAVRQYLRPERLSIAIVTPGGQVLKEALISGVPSRITYPIAKPPQILEEDEQIAAYPLRLSPEQIDVVTVDEVFQR